MIMSRQGNYETDLENTVQEISVRSEETSVLKERVTKLETELNVETELVERWHRLADDRLKHMENMRER